MKTNINRWVLSLLVFLLVSGCSDKEMVMGDLTAPSGVVVNTTVIGQDATHPNGDGSGDVHIAISAKNALAYKIDYDANDPLKLEFLPDGTVTKNYSEEGVHSYVMTVVAYGKGGTATTVTKEVTVRTDFTVSPDIVTALTGDASKTWVIEKNATGHFGVGPWQGSKTPEWYAAAPNEKAGCCNCFYTATFTFAKLPANAGYTLQVATPTGAFTKTGALTTLPGIPAGGDEGCYSYGGGTSPLKFVRSGTDVPASASTKTAISLQGNNTYIGYGAVQKDYEILSITPTALYLRVQGTETGNAWYMKLIPQ